MELMGLFAQKEKLEVQKYRPRFPYCPSPYTLSGLPVKCT